jgi:serine beta-lactamase-like protein LACTB
MSRITRGRTEVVLAGLFVVVILLVAGVAFYIVSTARIHTDAASVPSTAGAQTERYANAVEESRRLARALVFEQNLPGLSVAVARDGEIVWTEGFGWADMEHQAVVSPVTRFRLGAVSKTLTAAGIAVLHDRGRIDLNAPVQTYAPGYPQKQWTVTTRQVMAEVAGVHRIRGDNNDAMPSGHCADVGDALALVAGDPLLFEPGTQYRYSVWGWIVLSAVVEGAAEEPFAAFIRRQVLEPLGMNDTALEDSAGVGRIASLYRPRAALETTLGLEKEAPADRSCFAGAGAFLSTPSDMVRLGAAMVKPGFFKSATINLLQTPPRLASGASTDYALGWKVARVPLAGGQVRMVGHRGTPAGGTSSLQTFPDLGLAIAVMSNAGSAQGVDPFVLKIAEVFATGHRVP